jgi:hypothetical protein
MRAGSIAIFKLVSGEEMIGEVVSLADNTFVVKNSAVVMLQRTEQGMGVALMPYMPYCEGNISFYKDSLVAEGEPSQNMVNEYNRLYGSGIQIAPASALAGL